MTTLGVQHVSISTHLSSGQLCSKLGLDETRFHKAVELKGNDGARIKPKGSRVFGKVSEDIRRVEEAYLHSEQFTPGMVTQR